MSGSHGFFLVFLFVCRISAFFRGTLKVLEFVKHQSLKQEQRRLFAMASWETKNPGAFLRVSIGNGGNSETPQVLPSMSKLPGEWCNLCVGAKPVFQAFIRMVFHGVAR